MKKLILISLFALSSVYADSNDDSNDPVDTDTYIPFECYHAGEIYEIANQRCSKYSGTGFSQTNIDTDGGHYHYERPNRAGKMSLAYDKFGNVIQVLIDNPEYITGSGIPDKVMGDLECILMKKKIGI